MSQTQSTAAPALGQFTQAPSLFGRSATGRIITLAFMAALLVLPLIAYFTGNTFYLDFATRIVCLSFAAVSLNLILGFGGMISFGHAAFIGIGAYMVGIPTYHGFESGWLHFPLAMGVSALFALVTGAICLRTKGVYFIMITMAFAQMAYYFFLSLEEYGGDDGLTIYSRSVLNIIDIENKVVLFLLAYAALVTGIYAVYRIVNSRFGMVVRGCQSNEARMKALGYNTYAYRLTAYVIAGAMGGLAGALLGNFQSFISPDMMSWSRSGELMFMVILGGTGTLFGPVFGAVAFLVIEEILSAYTTYWALPFGILLILSVLFIKGGLSGLIHRGLKHG
jgi:branched-chain amino acid transport system permease protein